MMELEKLLEYLYKIAFLFDFKDILINKKIQFLYSAYYSSFDL